MELLSSENFEFFLRLLAALVLGAALGAERTKARKTAGMRTYALVSLGAALFVVISEIITQKYIGVTQFDPLRMASQVVVGIGFIGAGLIIFKGSKLRGLTTAAALWVAAAIGMACGFGLYAVGILATIFSLFILHTLWFVEQKVKKITQDIDDDEEEDEDDDE